MARKRKRPTKAKTTRRSTKPVFSIAAWMPMSEAIDRVAATLGGARALAMNEVREHMHRGRLRSAIRCLRGGKEFFQHLAPSYWEDFRKTQQSLKEGAAYLERPVRLEHGGGSVVVGRCWFFVDRRQFDKLYPAAPARAEGDDAPPRPPSSRPGPKAKHNWERRVVNECMRRSLASQRMPSAPEMVDWCVANLQGHAPEIRDMQRLLCRLRVLFEY